MALHIPIGPLKRHLSFSWYRDLNPVPTSQITDDSHSAIRAGMSVSSNTCIYMINGVHVIMHFM